MGEMKSIKTEFDIIIELLSNINNLLYFIADDIQKKNEKENNKLIKSQVIKGYN